MLKRVCLAFLLALCLSSLILAASEPPVPAAPPTPGAAAPAVLPAWLAPSPNTSLPTSPNFTPPFLFRNCMTDCAANFHQCKTDCAGDQSCIADCWTTLGCCDAFCNGMGCP